MLYNASSCVITTKTWSLVVAWLQLDLRGDAYGLLAAHPVAPLVSLHHLDYLAPITPRGGDRLGALRTLMDAARLDPARILQQCFCYEVQRGFAWSVSVSWGYTVQLYPRVLAANDMEVPLRTFKTWRSFGDGPFTFKTRQVAPDRPCDRPLLYFLSSVKKNGQDGSGSTMSEYSRYREEEDGRCKGLPGYGAALKVETVKVFAPKMDPAAWRRVRTSSSSRSRMGISNRSGWLRPMLCVSGTEKAVLPNASVMVEPYLGSTNKKLSPGWDHVPAAGVDRRRCSCSSGKSMHNFCLYAQDTATCFCCTYKPWHIYLCHFCSKRNC